MHVPMYLPVKACLCHIGIVQHVNDMLMVYQHI